MHMHVLLSIAINDPSAAPPHMCEKRTPRARGVRTLLTMVVACELGSAICCGRVPGPARCDCSVEKPWLPLSVVRFPSRATCCRVFSLRGTETSAPPSANTYAWSTGRNVRGEEGVGVDCSVWFSSAPHRDACEMCGKLTVADDLEDREEDQVGALRRGGDLQRGRQIYARALRRSEHVRRRGRRYRSRWSRGRC